MYLEQCLKYKLWYADQKPHICHVMRKMSLNEVIICKSTCNGSKSPCVLCQEQHTHSEQWENDLQQFLLQYSTIPLSSITCRADQVSIKKDWA